MKKTAINSFFLPSPVASFNRATKIDLGKAKLLIISGTASVGPKRQTMHVNDFGSQARRTYANIRNLLSAGGFKVEDVVQWRIYLKDIDRHYKAFNKARDAFFKENHVSRPQTGSSTCVEAKLCRKELLVEIEAIALKSS